MTDAKKHILARRAKFVAAALAGVSVTCAQTDPPVIQVPMTTVDGGGEIVVEQQTTTPPTHVNPPTDGSNADAAAIDDPTNTPPLPFDPWQRPPPAPKSHDAGAKPPPKKKPGTQPQVCLLMVLRDRDGDDDDWRID